MNVIKNLVVGIYSTPGSGTKPGLDILIYESNRIDCRRSAIDRNGWRIFSNEIYHFYTLSNDL